jgi:hypothetical protein
MSGTAEQEARSNTQQTDSRRERGRVLAWRGCRPVYNGIIQLSEELRGNEPREAQSGRARLAPPDFQWSHRALRALDSRWRLMHERSQPLHVK